MNLQFSAVKHMQQKCHEPKRLHPGAGAEVEVDMAIGRL